MSYAGLPLAAIGAQGTTGIGPQGDPSSLLKRMMMMRLMQGAAGGAAQMAGGAPPQQFGAQMPGIGTPAGTANAVLQPVLARLMQMSRPPIPQLGGIGTPGIPGGSPQQSPMAGGAQNLLNPFAGIGGASP